MAKTSYSVVDYYAEHERYSCGYCKSPDTNFSHGMWAYSLQPADYQALIDRGWRRSGLYCYKPTMNLTCCPTYTICCKATEFRPSKSQKKVLKRMYNFLAFGRDAKGIEKRDDAEDASPPPRLPEPRPPRDETDACPSVENVLLERPPVKKPKMEHKTQAPKPPPLPSEGKSLEEFLHRPLPENAAHRLQVKLVRSEPPSREFRKTFQAECQLYAKYQMAVHGDPPEKCKPEQFKRFLVDSPLRSSSTTFGSFHQQYWLDDTTLLAVGVLDILPECVSAVYFFYDPDYRFLSLGTYGSLQEIAMARELHQSEPTIDKYYMGFYIHSCPKMRYKGQYAPSFLLCPETYIWRPIHECRPLLDVSRYARLNPNSSAVDEQEDFDVDKIMVLVSKTIMTYRQYLNTSSDPEAEENSFREVIDYRKLVGRKCAETLVLIMKP